jgi:hypothetical protein
MNVPLFSSSENDTELSNALTICANNELRFYFAFAIRSVGARKSNLHAFFEYSSRDKPVSINAP